MIQAREIKRKSIQGAASFVLRTFFIQGIAFIATVFLGYYLSPEEFGIYFIVTSVVSIFTFLSDIGLAAALIQKKEDPTVDELRTTFFIQQTLAIGIFIAIVLLTPIWKTQNSLDKIGLELLYALALSFVLASLKTIPSILLERKLEFGKIIIPQIFENIVFYTIAVVLAAKGFGVRSYTVAVLARGVVGVILIYCIQSWPIGFSFSIRRLKHLINYGVKFQFNDFLARIKDDLFIVVLAKFLPAAEMGLISWAKRWSLFPYQLSVQNVLAVTFSTLSRLQEDKERLKKAIEKSLFYISTIIFPILGGLAMLAYPFTELIPRYVKWQPALPSLYFFCANIAFAAIANPMIHALNAIGKINKTLKLMIFWTVLTWITTPIFVYFTGFTGVSIASFLVAFSSVGTLFVLNKYVHIQLLDQIWRQFVATVFMMMTVFLIQKKVEISIHAVIFSVFIGAFIYCTVLLIVGFNRIKQEFRMLLSVVPGKLNK